MFGWFGDPKKSVSNSHNLVMVGGGGGPELLTKSGFIVTPPLSTTNFCSKWIPLTW